MKLKLLAVMLLVIAGSVGVVSAADSPAQDTTDSFMGRIETYPRQILRSGKGEIVLNVNIPRGFHATKDAPITFEWKADNGKVVTFTKDPSTYDFTKLAFPILIPLKALKGKTEVVIDASIFFCKDKSKVCQFDNVRLKIPVEVSNSGSAKLPITIDAVAKGSKEDL